jgi:hypothetical protein
MFAPQYSQNDTPSAFALPQAAQFIVRLLKLCWAHCVIARGFGVSDRDPCAGNSAWAEAGVCSPHSAPEAHREVEL